MIKEENQEIDLEKIRRYREDDFDWRDGKIVIDLASEWLKYLNCESDDKRSALEKLNEGSRLIKEAISDLNSLEAYACFKDFWREGIIENNCPEFMSLESLGWDSSSIDCM